MLGICWIFFVVVVFLVLLRNCGATFRITVALSHEPFASGLKRYVGNLVFEIHVWFLAMVDWANSAARTISTILAV